MRLYHTTDKKFSKIDLSKSRVSTDLGKGFYLTDDYKTAESYLRNGKFSNPFIKIYECDILDRKNILKNAFIKYEDIEIVNLNKVSKIEFIATLFHYRGLKYDFKSLLNVEEFERIKRCDILIGKIMDNNFYQLYTKLLVNRNIPLFLSDMISVRGNQFAFREKALKYLKELEVDLGWN